MSLTGKAAAERTLRGSISKVDVVYKDAYQLAVQNGFDGTIDEWLASIKGEKGDTGATGPKGDKGDKGDTGPQGIQGEKGDTGAQGPQGAQGPAGAKGDPGDKGADGKSAYAYAKEGGYTGTEEEFAEALVNALNGTGTSATYKGEVEVV